MITAVVTSDNHLGTYYARLRPDRLHLRRERLQRGFRQTVDVAIERKAQLFLIAGDLFDRPDPRNADRAFVAGELARLRRAGIEVVAICGNHDSPRLSAYDGSVVPLQEMEALEGLRLLRDESCWSEILLEIQDGHGQKVPVRIRGASHSFNVPEEVCPLETWCSTLNGPDPRKAPVEIVLMHYAVEGWEMPMAAEATLSLANLGRVTADLIAVGHLHVRNEKRLPGGALLLNPGATERIHFGEESHTSGCYVLQFEPDRPAKSEYVPLQQQPMRTLTITGEEILKALGTDAPVDPLPYLYRRIQETLAITGEPADSLLRIQITGVLPETVYNAIDANELRQYGQQRCFHCEVSLDDAAVRYANLEIELGSGGFEIDQEMTAIVDRLLAQINPDLATTPIERADAERRRVALGAARDALLAAYHKIKVG